MSKWWKEKGWRLIQTNLREIDMRDIDAERYVADLKSFGATVAMINAAGIIASYPTELPHHFQSTYLTGDGLDKIVDACHAADIAVVARTDFSKIRRPVYEMNPGWAYVSPKGHIVDYNGDVHACLNGGYQQEYAPAIIQELLTKLSFDGIFFNMGGFQVRDYSGNYHGICQCSSCRMKFRDRFGLDLPLVEDMSDPVFRRYLIFKREIGRESKRNVDALIHRLRPDMVVDKAYELGFGFIRQESNTAVDRPLPRWQYSATANTKWAVTSYPFMVSSNTTVDFIDFAYRHVAVSPHEQKIRLVETLANGGALDYYLIGRLDNHPDRSGYESIRQIFRYHEHNERYYLGVQSLAKIALVDDSDQRNTGEFRGWFRFLLESHKLFDTPRLDVMETMDLSRYQTVILPDCRYISDALAARVDEFVQSGGTLIASGQSSFFDQDYERRRHPALRSLGIESVQQIREDMRSSYFEVLPEEKVRFPRLAETDLIYHEPEYVYCRYAKGVETLFRLIPPHNYGPPERCYWETVVDRPGVTMNSFGTGMAIYLPWLPGSLFHRQGHTNTFDFAVDLLENTAHCRPVGGNLPSQVQVTHFVEKDGNASLVHLVNHSGHFGNTWFAPLTLADLTVEIEAELTPQRVTSLCTGRDLEHKHAEGVLVINVPHLGLFEAIRIS